MKISLSTEGFTDIKNITTKVKELVKKSGVKEGLCSISADGSTCGITTMEYESGLIQDLKEVLEEIAPNNSDYEHCKKWGDCNGYAHVRSSLINPFLTVPIEEGHLILGTWQQIAFLDFDNRPRKREIVVKILGE